MFHWYKAFQLLSSDTICNQKKQQSVREAALWSVFNSWTDFQLQWSSTGDFSCLQKLAGFDRTRKMHRNCQMLTSQSKGSFQNTLQQNPSAAVTMETTSGRLEEWVSGRKMGGGGWSGEGFRKRHFEAYFACRVATLFYFSQHCCNSWSNKCKMVTISTRAL